MSARDTGVEDTGERQVLRVLLQLPPEPPPVSCATQVRDDGRTDGRVGGWVRSSSGGAPGAARVATGPSTRRAVVGRG